MRSPACLTVSPNGCDLTDPKRKAFVLVQRGRMILDVAIADLQAAEALLGPFHSTSWYFRNALDEARRSWDRLRAELGGETLKAALDSTPLTHLVLGGVGPHRPRVVLLPISGTTYSAERVGGTPLAPIQWRLTRLLPPLDHGPYYASRLSDGLTRCDCADWTFRIAQTDSRRLCKHLSALEGLGWI